MWIADFKVWHTSSDSIELSREFDATLSVSNLNMFRDKGRVHIMRCGIFTGSQAAEYRQAFIERDKRVHLVASDANQVFFHHTADKAFHTLFFDRTVIFVGPTITRGGFQYWTVASLKKEPLMSLYKRVKNLGPQRATIQLLSLRQGEVNTFTQPALAQLTSLQRRALELACQHGYYSYPRRVSLEQLAKLVGIPRTTLQSHLRKAERTIIPALLNKELH